jgi:hypothetical protein
VREHRLDLRQVDVAAAPVRARCSSAATSATKPCTEALGSPIAKLRLPIGASLR